MAVVRVIVPPAPIVLPSDIAGPHAADDAAVAAMIQAVTEEIDGPTGWLGRALGPQTLELTSPTFWEISCGGSIQMPYPPIIGEVSVKYLDADGVEQTVDEANYRLVNRALVEVRPFFWPSHGCYPDAVRIRYDAGYNGDDVADGGTGAVPERARQAIILSVQHLKSLNVTSLYLKADEVEGIGRKEYTLSDQASAIVKQTSDRLLQGLRLYS